MKVAAGLILAFTAVMVVLHLSYLRFSSNVPRIRAVVSLRMAGFSLVAELY